MRIPCKPSPNQHPRCSRPRQEAARSLADRPEMILIYAWLDIGATPPQALCLLSQPLFVLRVSL